MNREDGKWFKLQDNDVKINSVQINRCFDGWIQHQGERSFVEAYNGWCRRHQNKDWVPYLRGVSFSNPEDHKKDWRDKWFVSVDLQSYDRDHKPGSMEPWEWRTLRALFIVDEISTAAVFEEIQGSIVWMEDSYVDPGDW